MPVASYSPYATQKPIDIVVRGACGAIGRQVVTMLARMVALSEEKGGVPQVRLWALVRSLQKLDGYSGSLAMSSNRGVQRNVESVLAYGVDGHEGPSQLFLQKDYVTTSPIKYITNTQHLPNPDLVIDCTGNIKYAQLKKIRDSLNAKRVIASAPVKAIPKGVKVPFKVSHVNTQQLEDFPIISAASCTTNGAASMIAPLIRNLPVDKPSDWLEGTLLTIHEPTGSQRVLDTTTNNAKQKQTMGTIFE